MPLLDHFGPPLHPRHRWESFYSNWATRIADVLDADGLPQEFIAAEFVRGSPSLALPPGGWVPPAPSCSMPAVFPDSFEVRVFSTDGGFGPVGVIALVSPDNKGRAEERRAFAAKCADYLHRGASLIIIDIVTNCQANLHNELIRLMGAADEMKLPDDMSLYGVAYRPVLRQKRAEIDIWTSACAVGQPLPLLPLRLTGDLFVPVDLEVSYQEACRRRRLA
jgi:hypothetical protein